MTTDRPEPQSEERTAYQPTLRDMLMLQAPFGVKIAPGNQRSGGRVAALVRTTNWKDNGYEDVCHIYDPAGGTGRRLTRWGSVSQMEWLDGDTLALLRQGSGEDDKAQIWLYEGLVGEGWPVTDHETGVDWFKPFAGGFLFRAKDPKREKNKSRAGRFGKYTHFEQEESASALYYVGLEEVRHYRDRLRAATNDEAEKLVKPVVEISRLLPERLAIRDVIPSPADDAVYLTCWPREDLVYWRDTTVFQLALDAPAALAEYVLRQEAKKEEEEEEKASDGGEEGEEEDLSYLGTITRLNAPRGAEAPTAAGCWCSTVAVTTKCIHARICGGSIWRRPCALTTPTPSWRPCTT